MLTLWDDCLWTAKMNIFQSSETFSKEPDISFSIKLCWVNALAKKVMGSCEVMGTVNEFSLTQNLWFWRPHMPAPFRMSWNSILTFSTFQLRDLRTQPGLPCALSLCGGWFMSAWHQLKSFGTGTLSWDNAPTRLACETVSWLMWEGLPAHCRWSYTWPGGPLQDNRWS